MAEMDFSFTLGHQYERPDCKGTIVSVKMPSWVYKEIVADGDQFTASVIKIVCLYRQLFANKIIFSATTEDSFQRETTSY
jgi:hypothetical protein